MIYSQPGVLYEPRNTFDNKPVTRLFHQPLILARLIDARAARDSNVESLTVLVSTRLLSNRSNILVVCSLEQTPVDSYINPPRGKIGPRGKNVAYPVSQDFPSRKHSPCVALSSRNIR